MFYLNIIIRSLFTFHLCTTCRHTQSIKPYHIKLVEDKFYAPFNECNFTLKNPKIVINPYKEEVQNVVQPKPFASLCLKCAACLVIADEITKAMKVAKEEVLYAEDKSLGNMSEEMAEKIYSLCHKGFKKLREMCNLYTSYMDLNNINPELNENIEELTNRLCRGTGIFRDCINVDYEKYMKILKELKECNICPCPKS